MLQICDQEIKAMEIYDVYIYKLGRWYLLIYISDNSHQFPSTPLSGHDLGYE